MNFNVTRWKWTIITGLLVFQLFSPSPIPAAVIGSRAALTAQLGSAAVTEDFESYIFPANSAKRVGLTLDATTVIEGQGPGLVRSGVRFSAPDADPQTYGGLQWDRQFSYGLQSAAMVTDGRLVVDFTVPVTHVGFDMFWFHVGFALAHPGTVQVYAADDVTLLYTVDLFEPYAPESYFFGYSDSRGIGRIVLFRDESPFLGVSPIIDNLTFGYAVSLSMAVSGQQVTLIWPDLAAGYQLQSTPTAAQPESWTLVTDTPVVLNGQKIISVPITGPVKFFRLIKL